MPAATAITIAVKAPSRNIFIGSPNRYPIPAPESVPALRGYSTDLPTRGLLAFGRASGLVADLVAFTHLLELAFGALVGVARCLAGLLVQSLLDLGGGVGTLARAHDFLPLTLWQTAS